MDYTKSEVLQFVQENDVKFIRLAFCDMFGTQKNISIMADELPRAFKEGFSFDASSVQGFMYAKESDLFLYPDPATLSVLPWRPDRGRVVRFFCDIKYPNGAPFEGDGRNILRTAAERLLERGYVCKIGPECEFYLFEADEKGHGTLIPYDDGTYFDIAPMDKGENVRREICLTLEEMGIKPESSHHEQGPGQNEIEFLYSDALSAADNFTTFKSVVKTIASGNGLFASFMPKPLPYASGSGLHINMSLYKNGSNLFETGPEHHSAVAESFIAGILNRVRELTVLLNPTVNSYERFGCFEAPRYISWSHQNRSQLIRIPAASREYSRMELRSPDPTCNPYLAFAMLMYAGLEGIENDTALQAPADFSLSQADKAALKEYPMLPLTLGEAVEIAEQSEFLKKYLPGRTLTKFLEAKSAEWQQYNAASDKAAYQHELYFQKI